MEWGLLGPERIVSERRTRTLGVAAAVRAFNDQAVPGMGNVFFGKQLLLATMGIRVAEHLRREGSRCRNIETANAIEALACRLALESNGWQSDMRLRGVTKLRGTPVIVRFEQARRRGFYVTTPMRMATVQPLLALGLVDSESERFNAYRVGQRGRDLIEAVCEAYGESYRSSGVFEHLARWAAGAARALPASPLAAALSPILPLPVGARPILRDCIVAGDTEEAGRRRAVLAWVDRVAGDRSAGATWSDRPLEIGEDHWEDLQAGARFFALRDAALRLLDRIEGAIRDSSKRRFELGARLAGGIGTEAEAVSRLAGEFLALEHDRTSGALATQFCRECTGDTKMVEALVQRDDRILRMSGRAVIPGPAFEAVQAAVPDLEGDGEDVEEGPLGPSDAVVPPGISLRVWNMLLLGQDLGGKIEAWL